MPVIGVNLTKLNAEKKLAITGAVDVNNNVRVTDITSTEITLGNVQEKGLKFAFEFKSTYDPDVGSISVEGDLIYKSDEKKNKEILDNWKKNKKIDQDLMTELLNIVLRKCSLEALLLGKELMLPSPIPMPVFRTEK